MLCVFVPLIDNQVTRLNDFAESQNISGETVTSVAWISGGS